MKSSKLMTLLERFPGHRVAVVGDLMLDVYCWGRAVRLSPEAPVPVVEVERITSCLGGAANVMRNLVTLGAEAVAFGMIGDDEDGRTVLAELDGYGIDRTFVLKDPKRRTTRKQRVIAGTQQLLRIDHERTDPAPAAIRRRLVEGLLAAIREHRVDAVIFEDYRKGVLSSEMLAEVTAAAREAGVITALDPKPGSLAPVPGLTVIKPNRSEACAMAEMSVDEGDRAGLNRVAEVLQKLWQPEYLLVSLAAEGMALYRRNGRPTRIPTRAREVFDVSGAGDTLVAAFTLSLAAGISPKEAAEIANHAAGIVVGKVGTVPVTLEDLRKALA